MTDATATTPSTSTPDSPAKKTILRAIRDGLQWILHIALIPVVAALKAAVAGITYAHDELAKI